MRKMMLLVSLMMLMLLGTASVASAFELRQSNGGLLTVGKNETVDDDMVIAGGSAVIDGTVNGDVLALGDTVTVNGTINGTLISLGTRVEIKGAVNGAVIAAGDSVHLQGSVQRSLIGAGSRVLIYETGTVGGSLVAAGDRLEHRGAVARGAALAGSDLLVTGKIGKELKAGAERLAFGSSAVVEGPVDLWSANPADVASGARIGAVTMHQVGTDLDQLSKPWYVQPGWIILKFGGFLAVGLALLAVAPHARRRFPEIMASQVWQAPLAGFLALIATPVAAILLLITVIGIPLGVIALLAYPVLIYLSQILVAWSVGRLLADRIPALQNQAWPVLFLVGAALTTFLVEVPYFGPFMGAASLFYGLGGIWLLITGRERAV